MKTLAISILLFLAATAAHAAQFTLTWVAPAAAAEGVTQFRIYSIGATQTLLATVTMPQMTATISLPSAPGAYTLVCRAVNSYGESGDSNQIILRVTPPTPPAGFRVQ